MKGVPFLAGSAVLMGTRLPAHLLWYGATVEEVVNLGTAGAVEAASRPRGAAAGWAAGGGGGGGTAP